MFGDRGDSGRMAEGAEMIPDLDIYRAANVLVKQHGEDALIGSPPHALHVSR